MLGTILENLNSRKLSILVLILLLIQLACFLLGGLVSPPPASSQEILSTICVDPNPEANKNKWFIPKCRTVDVNLQDEEQMRTMNPSNLVFVFKMPLHNMAFTQWQQNLVGVLQIDMIYRTGQTLENLIELTLDSRLAYRNKWDPEDKWTYYASAQEKRITDCSFDHDNKLDGYPYNCSTVPLFELGSLHHDYYLLNFRLPVDENTHVADISDIYLHIIYMNEGFTKVWLSLKTVFFVVTIVIIVWFWQRVYMLSRTPALLEYILLSLGGTLAILNMPLEFLTLHFNIPYMLLCNDIRQGIFYAALLSFWLIFTGEHMLIQDNGKKSTLKMYWPQLSAVLVICLSLLIFDLCKRGGQLYNPFFSIWVTPVGTKLALSFIIFASILAGIYFMFLCYMIWTVVKSIRIKPLILPSMSTIRRTQYENNIDRFNFLMLATVICAAVTIISFILNQIAEGQNKWDENMKLEVSSAPFTGVYGMWNVYIFAMLILYAPSHKQWPVDPISPNNEEITFQKDKTTTEVSNLIIKEDMLLIFTKVDCPA